MTVFMHELRRGLRGFIIWAFSIAAMLILCVMMYPEMKGEVNQMNDLFANMGSFTEAFGMDKLNFGTLIGFYGIECGNILGIGGGFFAAYLGITMLSKEENDHTAEFLLTHPVRRIHVVMSKLFAVVTELVVLNVVVMGSGFLSILAIGEEMPTAELLLIHTAYFLMQLEVGLLCFGISAFMRRASVGIGLGIAALLYFFNIVRNISDNAEFLKYITPYAYADPADIVESAKINGGFVLLGLVYALLATTVGILYYHRKDISQ